MDREILFRGKTKYGSWIIGDLLQYANTAQIWTQEEHGKCNYIVDPATVGQFTGLTDKNKIPQKVFEGDIVEYILSCEKYCGQVCYGIYEQDGSGGEYCPTLCIGFYIKCLFWTPQDWQEEDDERIYSYNRTVSLLNVEELMVIGNTHDNPELLKGESE